MSQRRESEQPLVYEVRIEGHLEHRWTDWSEEATVTLEETGDTLLTLSATDQAALHGLLRRLRDLGATLISINPAGPEQAGQSSKEKKNR